MEAPPEVWARRPRRGGARAAARELTGSMESDLLRAVPDKSYCVRGVGQGVLRAPARARRLTRRCVRRGRDGYPASTAGSTACGDRKCFVGVDVSGTFRVRAQPAGPRAQVIPTTAGCAMASTLRARARARLWNEGDVHREAVEAQVGPIDQLVAVDDGDGLRVLCASTQTGPPRSTPRPALHAQSRWPTPTLTVRDRARRRSWAPPARRALGPYAQSGRGRAVQRPCCPERQRRPVPRGDHARRASRLESVRQAHTPRLRLRSLNGRGAGIVLAWVHNRSTSVVAVHQDAGFVVHRAYERPSRASLSARGTLAASLMVPIRSPPPHPAASWASAQPALTECARRGVCGGGVRLPVG